MDTITAAGGAADLATLDVTDPATVEQVTKSALERHGRIDILVNNAGVTRDQLMLRMKREDWDNVIAANLDRGVYAARTRPQGHGEGAARPHHQHHVGGG